MTVLARFSKAAAALIGSLVGVLVAFSVGLTPEQGAALVPFLTTLATILAPANAPAVPTPGPDVPTATDAGKPMQLSEGLTGDPERLPNA